METSQIQDAIIASLYLLTRRKLQLSSPYRRLDGSVQWWLGVSRDPIWINVRLQGQGVYEVSLLDNDGEPVIQAATLPRIGDKGGPFDIDRIVWALSSSIRKKNVFSRLTAHRVTNEDDMQKLWNQYRGPKA